MTPEAIQELYRYSYWASERVWGCIMLLTDDQFTQDIAYSIGSIRNQVVHMIGAEYRWMFRIMGSSDTPEQITYDDYPTRAATKTKWEYLKAHNLAYIDSLTQAQLNEPVMYRLAHRGIDAQEIRWKLLLHVANHATDHRAQILAMLHHHFNALTVEQDMLFYLLEKQE